MEVSYLGGLAILNGMHDGVTKNVKLLQQSVQQSNPPKSNHSEESETHKQSPSYRGPTVGSFVLTGPATLKDMEDGVTRNVTL